MSTIQTTSHPARFHRPTGIVTAAVALIAVGIAALLLTLTGTTRTNHLATRHSARAEYHGTYYPRVQQSAVTAYHGTYYPRVQHSVTVRHPVSYHQARAAGAPGVAATGLSKRTVVNPRKSYGAVP